MLSRRLLLQAAAASATLAQLPLSARLAMAGAEADKRLIVVVLRGAMDGLAAAAPWGDRDYRAQRGALALARPGEPGGLLDLDGLFGLHPALAPLQPLWARGELAIAPAVATGYRDRSHFDAQDILENGTDTAYAVPDGWLNRALAPLGGHDRKIGLAVGTTVPLLMRGPVRIATYAPKLLPDVDDAFLAKVRQMYAGDDVLHTMLEEAVESSGMVEQAMGEPVRGEPAMADSGMGAPRRRRIYNPRRKNGPEATRELFTAAGKLLADANGPRIAVIDTGGWDTHAGQGAAEGALAIQFRTLASGLAALPEALGPAWAKTAVIVVTEFGRTAQVNGSGGTDHGTGSLALLMGGAVRGGRVLTPWPGMSEKALFEGRDVAPATDLRALFKGLLRDHAGVPEAALEDKVFPGSRSVRPLDGLVRL